MKEDKVLVSRVLSLKIIRKDEKIEKFDGDDTVNFNLSYSTVERANN
jgi:hypothetical protein